MLSPYEQKVLLQIEERKRRELERSPRRLVPQRLKDAAADAGDRVNRVPGAQNVSQAASKGFEKAAAGLGRFATRSSQFTLSPERVLAAYRQKANVVDDLAGIRSLDLAVVDRVGKFMRMNHLYAGLAMLEGAVAAAIVSGGEALTAAGIFDMGATAAPGIGAVATAVGGDAAAVLVIGSRVVAHTALLHGYDPRDPREEVFMMSVLGLGAATTQGTKLAAYGELSQLTQALARKAPWEKLDQFVLAAIAKKFAERFGLDLTKKKLGQFVPIAGVAIGGGLNYVTVDRIADAAYWAYRERFLREKLGEPISVPEVSAPQSQASEGEAPSPAIDVLGILKEEGIDTNDI